MTTLANVIDETRRRVQGTHRTLRNTLASSVSAGATSLPLDHDATGIAAGTIAEIGLEQFYVWSVATNTLTVQPGQNGTAEAAHTAGDLVYLNPELSAQAVLDEVNHELNALSSVANGLFAVETETFTYDPSVDGYELDVTGFIDVLTVKFDTTGPEKLWPEIPRKFWRVKRDADTTDFPSGVSIVLYAAAQPGQTVRVTCKKGFTALAALSDNLTTTGLPASAYDILSLGAAARLVASRESQRSLSGARSDFERAEAVPPGASIGSSRHLLAIRQQRIAEEAARLAAQYPSGGGR